MQQQKEKGSQKAARITAAPIKAKQGGLYRTAVNCIQYTTKEKAAIKELSGKTTKINSYNHYSIIAYYIQYVYTHKRKENNVNRITFRIKRRPAGP